MIQIYCGDGKGKTTAAAGLAIRAAGHGFPVVFAQFLKDDSSGEIQVLKSLPQIHVMHGSVFYGFVRQMTEEQKAQVRDCYRALFDRITRKLSEFDSKATVVVLDEVIHACNFGLVDEDWLCRWISRCQKQNRGETEFVLTGKGPSERLLATADYVSEIKKKKHPFDRGIAAREGIER